MTAPKPSSRFCLRMLIPAWTNSWKSGHGYPKWLSLHVKVGISLHVRDLEVDCHDSRSNGKGQKVGRCPFALLRSSNCGVCICGCKLSFRRHPRYLWHPQDYSVSITCTDQLSATGGSFDLRFSRCPHAPWITNPVIPNLVNGDLFNPHDDAEPFMRHVLRHGRLAPSLHRLVGLLRDTLPIVAELEAIRVRAEKEGDHLDTFAKAAGWYRVLYGDLRWDNIFM